MLRRRGQAWPANMGLQSGLVAFPAPCAIAMRDLPAIDPSLLGIDPPKPEASAESAAAPAPTAALAEDSIIRRRRLQPIDEPLPQTRKWIATLPDKVQPLELLRQFPRIANALALMWSESDSFKAYMDDLLGNRRGNRHGFPKAIRQELLALRAFREPTLPALDWHEQFGKRG